MDYNAEYLRWVERVEDSELAAELKAVKDSEDEKKGRFGAELEFGTAGLRGVLGAGCNRMNIYTVRRATQGLAEYVLKNGGGCVAVSYDSRRHSEEFARESARVLAANGVKAWLYDRLMPTPMLSYAVRRLGCAAGIMITASHNPAQYNGYKAYGPDGCQMTIEAAAEVYANIQSVDTFDGVKLCDFDAALASGQIQYITEEVVGDYYRAVEEQQLNAGVCEEYPVKLVYSPLNGTGNEPVRKVLCDIGVRDISIVKEQELPDGDFPTCTYPNPETEGALKLGLALCESEKPDLFIATDPDADRVGVAIRDGEGYRRLTGNEVGALILSYIVAARNQNGSMPKNPVAVRSIVSSALTDRIAEDGGVEMRVVLTGFKFIGEQILMLENRGEQGRFIFGFEESCGYLAGSYVRDKDAVFASMMLCELTAWCKKNGTTPAEMLDGIYKKYGFYLHRVISIEFGGLDGTQRMKDVMQRLFSAPPKDIDGIKAVSVCDYKKGERVNPDGSVTPTGLPSSEVLELGLEGGASVIIRPSGTEPKMKIYLTACESSKAGSLAMLDRLEKHSRGLVG